MMCEKPPLLRARVYEGAEIDDLETLRVDRLSQVGDNARIQSIAAWRTRIDSAT